MGVPIASPASGVGAHLKALFAFSRGLQATLSLAQPALAAIIAAHGFPEVQVVLIGAVAAASGFLAVFALNDFLDVGLDRRRFAFLKSFTGFDIDAAFVRHPLAQGYISYREGFVWIAGMFVISAAGALYLNPWAAVCLVGAGALEVAYCRMAQVSAWKFLPTGVMVGLGALAGWFAVDGELDLRVLAFFVWMFAWEIGGRNIVNDWSDVEEDLHLGIKTVPVQFGVRTAANLILGFVVLTLVASIGLAYAASPYLNWFYVLWAVVFGAYTLLLPSWRLARDHSTESAHRLFNLGSLYPPAMLVALVASLYLPGLS